MITRLADISAPIAVAFFVALAVVIAFSAGTQVGDDRARRRHADAAAAICPTCTSFVEPATRLRDCRARIDKVTHRESEHYPFGSWDPNPVTDANIVLRAAVDHVERLERRGIRP